MTLSSVELLLFNPLLECIKNTHFFLKQKKITVVSVFDINLDSNLDLKFSLV
jgi:hypothetical protein